MRAGCKRRRLGKAQRCTLSGLGTRRTAPALPRSGLGEGSGSSDLLPDAKLVDEAAVPREVFALQIVQQPPTLSDEHHQASPRMMVLAVGLEMLRPVGDALAQDGYLHLG